MLFIKDVFPLMSNPLSLDKFSEIASETILDIIDAIENHDTKSIVDINIGDVVEINISMKNSVSSKTQYILNKHNNYRQIWLVSPISGPYHFGYSGSDLKKKWVDKNGIVLEELLTKELSQFIDKIKFS